MNEKLANPAPLGLMGFGMTTVLLNIHNAGFMPISAMILAMGLAYGGLAQVIAGILEFKKGNTFGLTAFTSYGFFWISLVFLLLLPKLGLGEAADEFAMGWVAQIARVVHDFAHPPEVAAAIDRYIKGQVTSAEEAQVRSRQAELDRIGALDGVERTMSSIILSTRIDR